MWNSILILLGTATASPTATPLPPIPIIQDAPTLGFLDTITQWLANLVEGVWNLLKMIWNLVTNIDEYVKLVGIALSNVPNYLSWLPPAAGGIIALLITVAILMKTVGRDG